VDESWQASGTRAYIQEGWLRLPVEFTDKSRGKAPDEGH